MERSGEENRVEGKHTHVFIVGSKGIPAQYGGFETFVENLTKRKVSENIKYHVSCMNNDEKHFIYNRADCFNVRIPCRGAVGRILHVSRVLTKIEKWKKNNIGQKTIVYILGCRIGPLLIPHAKKMRKLRIKIYVNPDGLEWKRDKWNKLTKIFLKLCERCLVMNADLIICDSLNIEKYIKKKYLETANRTKYIAYGADVELSKCEEHYFEDWLKKVELKRDNYYLLVGRFVPENNFETIIREFILSKSTRELVIITTANSSYMKKLNKRLNLKKEINVKFAGTVYNQELLKKIRENAYGYFHGHEVGGTNPSLIEALSSTKINLLLNVGFNKEVAKEGAFYWNKAHGSLAEIIKRADKMSIGQIEKLEKKAKLRISSEYTWESICKKYEDLFQKNSF